MNTNPHLVRIGGLPKAGKSTAVACLQKYLARMGLRALLVTDDRGIPSLNGTALDSNNGKGSGKCCCCRPEAEIGSSGRYSRFMPPDLYIAETDGAKGDFSCHHILPECFLEENHFTLAPVSVMVEPIQLEPLESSGPEIYPLAPDSSILERLLEHADIVVINKIDLVEEKSLLRLKSHINSRYPEVQVFAVSCQEPRSLENWFTEILFNHSPLTMAEPNHIMGC